MILAIEGIDGSGKGTQAHAICQLLSNRFEKVDLVSFPRYGRSKGAHLVTEYLNGRIYGAMTDVIGPAMFFALDRFEALPLLQEYQNSTRKCLVVDRYVASNIAHQTCKEQDEAARFAYQNDIYRIEHGILEVPKPDCTVLFNIDPSLAQARVNQKAKREYTPHAQDVHERSLSYLKNAAACYRELLARGMYANFHQLDVGSDDQPLVITEKVAKLLEAYLIKT